MYYLIISNGNVTRQEYPPLPDQHKRAMDGSIIVLKINDGVVQKLSFGNQDSCYVTVPKSRPLVDGLYQVRTFAEQDWDYRRVASFEGDHWRTIGGRVEGDNRIPDGHIIDWKGPLVCSSDSSPPAAP